MADKAYRAAPLSQREQDAIRAEYKPGDSFRGADALAEKYNVPPSDISAVANHRYRKGRRKAKRGE